MSKRLSARIACCGPGNSRRSRCLDRCSVRASRLSRLSGLCGLRRSHNPYTMDHAPPSRQSPSHRVSPDQPSSDPAVPYVTSVVAEGLGILVSCDPDRASDQVEKYSVVATASTQRCHSSTRLLRTVRSVITGTLDVSGTYCPASTATLSVDGAHRNPAESLIEIQQLSPRCRVV
jgi:hypothetical protein